MLYAPAAMRATAEAAVTISIPWALTADGSKMADWAKMTTQTFNSPSGPFQVHFYQNLNTGATHFSDDFKAVFKHNGVWP